ncbi:hypothetical protein FQN49_001875 [Arthroderma sp. PD_2]|nr:hypothetical protein FQN49_001875 [Arthroderma sp. PD_2]
MKSIGLESTELPDAIVGDLDSIHLDVRKHYESLNVTVIENPDQYSTDFMKCLSFLADNCSKILGTTQQTSHDDHGTGFPRLNEELDVIVFGGLGGRVDQGFAQIHHLFCATPSASAQITRPRGKIYLISEESISFFLHQGENTILTPGGSSLKKPKGEIEPGNSDSADKRLCLSENIGIIPIGGPSLITTQGLEWDVENWRTEFGGQLSTSNHIRADAVEIHTSAPVLFTVDAASDLVSLSSTCFRLNLVAVPLLYKCVTLSISHSHRPADVTVREIPWVACIRGLARNWQGQSPHVKKFVIKGVRRYYDLYGAVPSGIERRVIWAARKRSFEWPFDGLMANAFSQMKNLESLTWTSDCVYPTNQVFSLVPAKLKALTYQYPRLLEYGNFQRPCHLDPDIRHIHFDSVVSLSIFGISFIQTLQDISRILVLLREQLKILRLGYSKGPIEFACRLPVGTELENKRQWDDLVHMMKQFAQFKDPIKLHTLEVFFCPRFDLANWGLAFDFNTIENFSLVQTYTYPTPADLWTHLKERGTTFKRLKTDSHFRPKEFTDYLQTFDSLEELYLVSNSPSINFIRLSSHFSNLRVLLSVTSDHIEGLHLEALEILIDGCPRLEELGISLTAKYEEDVWEILGQAPALKRMYFVEYKRYWPDRPMYFPNAFVYRFFAYYYSNPSPFFRRLERLSYVRTLWNLVDLTPDEQYACYIRKETPQGKYDLEFDRIAIPADWDAYWDDEMVSTIHAYVMGLSYLDPWGLR